ncbi:hypothetical protein [Alkalibacterium olivapovliticus]|uniref:Uncharacterized protein n=1 Tax=Alkalibacterium olivapovliticus TaxID=99907 RepID=A0A2T0W841_9LACT|nr:hypothetical protein [Alkalibacterium olivapovliticus]PRY82873.1 hypothetical protein CLV38_10883 [Alkalibacterium olivapovliticus]
MRQIKKEVYEEIQKDLPRIEQAMSSRNGSQNLWAKLKSKYPILLPGILAHVRQSAKFKSVDLEPDFRPELTQLKEAILAYLIVHPVEEGTNEKIENKASEQLEQSTSQSIDEIVNNKIEESKLYIRDTDSDKKQIALEKIWDGFERLKTVYGEDKKASVKELITAVSNGSAEAEKVLDDEFNELTAIGNSYQIRHFENGKTLVHSDHQKEYFYFRMLSLISYCLNEMK